MPLCSAARGGLHMRSSHTRDSLSKPPLLVLFATLTLLETLKAQVLSCLRSRLQTLNHSDRARTSQQAASIPQSRHMAMMTLRDLTCDALQASCPDADVPSPPDSPYDHMGKWSQQQDVGAIAHFEAIHSTVSSLEIRWAIPHSFAPTYHNPSQPENNLTHRQSPTPETSIDGHPSSDAIQLDNANDDLLQSSRPSPSCRASFTVVKRPEIRFPPFTVPPRVLDLPSTPALSIADIYITADGQAVVGTLRPPRVVDRSALPPKQAASVPTDVKPKLSRAWPFEARLAVRRWVRSNRRS